MAKDKRSFVADIKDTRLRRAMMLVVVPVLLSPLIPSVCVALWRALGTAVFEFGDQMRWEFNSRAMRALKLGLKQMWSKDWNTDQ